MLVCGLTATPDICYMTDKVFQDSFNYLPFNFIDISSPREPKYKPKKIEIWPHTKLSTLLKNIKLEGNTLIYVESAREARKYAANYDAGFLISKYNEDRPNKQELTLSEEMDNQIVKNKQDFHTRGSASEEITLREYVLQYCEFPPEYNTIFINSAYSCGMNIKDEKLQTIIIESDNIDTIWQVMGRARNNFEKAIIVYTSYVSPVQEKNDRRLFEAIQSEESAAQAGEVINYKLAYDMQTEIRAKELKEKGNTSYNILFSKYKDTYYINPFAKIDYEMRQNAKSTYLQSPLTFAEKVRHTTGCEDVVVVDKDEKEKERRDSILDNNEQAVLDFNWEPYLNVNLFKEEQEEIVQALNLRYANNRQLKFKAIVSILQKHGYTINKKRIVNKRNGQRNVCIIIT